MNPHERKNMHTRYNKNTYNKLDDIEVGKTYELHLKDSSFLEEDYNEGARIKQEGNILENDELKYKDEVKKQKVSNKIIYILQNKLNYLFTKEPTSSNLTVDLIEDEISNIKQNGLKESDYLSNMKKVDLDYNKSFINEYATTSRISNNNEGIKNRKIKNKPKKLLTVNDLDLVEETSLKKRNERTTNTTNTIEDYNYLEELIDIEREKNIKKEVKEKSLNNRSINMTNNYLNELIENEDVNPIVNDTSNNNVNGNDKLNLLSSLLVEEDNSYLFQNSSINNVNLEKENTNIQEVTDSNYYNKNAEINKSNEQNISKEIKLDKLLGNKRTNQYSSQLTNSNNTNSINTNKINNINNINKTNNVNATNNSNTSINLEAVTQVKEITNAEKKEKEVNPYDPNNEEEPLIGKGVFNALCILRSRGYLDNHEYVGRYKEKDPYKSYYNENDKIKLEYRDNLGRLMTSKQANRYLSRIFQGKNKHNNNIEKEMVKDQIENVRKNKDINTDSLMMSMLKKHQNKFKTPGMTLQSSKPTIN